MMKDNNVGNFNKHNITYYDDDLIITKVPNVNENQLEECINIIQQSNSEITFNLINYSKENQELTFYTNKKMNLDRWNKKEEQDVKKKTITTADEMKKEIEKLLKSSRETENACLSFYDRYDMISLYEVGVLLKIKHREFYPIIKNMKKSLAYSYKEYNKILNAECSKIRFVYEEKEFIEVKLGGKIISEHETYIYYRKNNNIYMIDKYGNSDEKLLCLTLEKARELFDIMEEYRDYLKEEETKINAVNSKFLVNISKENGIILKPEIPYFYINFTKNTNNEKNHYSFVCTGNDLVELIYGKEEQLFKNIYVKIDDCPKWMHERLYQRRKEMFEEEKLEEAKRKRKESQKQKRLEFKKRFFSFKK